MREILFKAKRINNGKWIEGYYFYNPNIDKHFVHNWLSGGLVEVNKDTICRFTGFNDKNGNKIWENDIVMLGEDLYIITWEEDDAMFALKDVGIIEHFGNVDSKWCEVVGNKFDNPKLLEGSE